jgi:hypothetical protein
MNTDQGQVTDYVETMSDNKISEIKILLDGINEKLVDDFLGKILRPISILSAHAKARATIPDGREQKRYYKRLEKHFSKLQSLADIFADELDRTTLILDELDKTTPILNAAPFELRQKLRAAHLPLSDLQDNHLTALLAMRDLEPSKSKFRPEVKAAVRNIATKFELSFKIKPIICAFKDEYDLPADLSLAKRFVPLLAILLDRSIDQAYRLSKKNLSS